MLLTVSVLCAGDREDALAAIEPLAAALSDGDAAGFVRRVPKGAPGFDELSENVRALLAMAEVTSSVEVLSASSDKAELDWYMHIRSRENQMLLERRRGTVAIEFKGSELRSIAPASFFAPPKV